jgi:hypothetical protein
MFGGMGAVVIDFLGPFGGVRHEHIFALFHLNDSIGDKGGPPLALVVLFHSDFASGQNTA